MKDNLRNNINNERGFILVTSIILLAILMGLGAAAMFKSQIEIKVSASAADTAKAFAAAQAGLDKTYQYWSQIPAGQAEFSKIANRSAAGGIAPGAGGTNILINLAPQTMADLGVTAALVDAAIQGSNARVYNLTSAGISAPVPAANWNVDNYAQVAVWTARFQPSATGYPYATPQTTTATCPSCTAVTYALGRSGNAYKLMREYSFVSTTTIQAFGAMINAPQFKNDADCASGTASTTSSTVTPNPVPPGNNNWSHLIDSTQAPGGVAMSSNNGVNPSVSNKSYPNATGTTLTTRVQGINQTIDMFVVYDPGKVNALGYSAIAGGFMSTLWNTVTRVDRFGAGTTMNYFGSPSQQLFPLDAYREAANRISGFQNETINGFVVATGGNALGNYGALRVANGGFARMGTIQWADLQNNIQNSVPMYGLLRFMIPLEPNGTKTVCGTSVTKYSPSGLVDPIGLGTEAPNGKLIVYGGALFDFFTDNNTNQIFEPALGERVLTRNEAKAAGKLNVDSPLMFNPVMDDNTPRPSVGPSAATVAENADDILKINVYPNGSPSWDLASDAPANADGVMDLIWDVDNVARNWSSMVLTGGVNRANPFTFASWMTRESPARVMSTSTTGGLSWSFGDRARMSTMLDYYIRTTAQASRNVWSDGTRSTIEGNAGGFYIDSPADLLANTPSDADLYHAFLPSGYVHGWKRAMQVTGLTAVGSDGVNSIWNTDLIVATSPMAAREQAVFNISGVGAAAVIDQNFADVPAEMYAGGLVDMHHSVNISGVVYTPGALELEQKTMGKRDGTGGATAALQYINGIIISGGGVYMKDETGTTNARTIIVYDDTSIDNLPTNNSTLTLGRKYWQELK